MYSVIVRRRERDFSPYIDFLGEEFASKLAKHWLGFSKTLRRDATENTYSNHVNQFLRFVCEEESLSKFREFVKSNQSLSKGQEIALWQVTLNSYREHIKNQKIPRTANGLVGGVRRYLCEYLPNKGVMHHGLQLKGFPYSLGAMRGTTVLSTKTLNSLGMSSAQFNELCKEIASETGDSDIELDSDIIDLLSDAFDEAEGDSSQIDRVGIAIRILETRTEALATTAAEEYFKFIQDTNEVKEWLRSPVYDEKADELWELLNASESSNQKTHDYDNALLDAPLEVFVVMLKKHHGGVYPKETEAWYGKFSSCRGRYGITNIEIKRRLGIDMYAMTCAYTFIILQAYANSESIRNLKIDDLFDGVTDSQYILKWQKPRAGTWSPMQWTFHRRPADVVFSAEHLTVEEVFKHQLECRAPYEGLIFDEDKNNLFIGWQKNSRYNDKRERIFVPATPHVATFNQHFKKLCKVASDGAWVVTPKSVRGSKLLLEGLVTRDILSVKAKAQHQHLMTSGKYLHLIPEWLRREQNIRDFLDWFEALVTVDIEGFAQKVGIEEDAYAHRLTVARAEREKDLEAKYNQQFGGIHCVNPYEGVQPGTEEGKVCNKVQNCPTCKNRRGLFVLTLDNLINVMQWNAVLEEADAMSRPEWQKWLVFTRIILGNIRDDARHATLYETAKKELETSGNPYRTVIPIKAVK